jgi:hypothetical protein
MGDLTRPEPSDAERGLMRLLRCVVRGQPVDWSEVTELRKVVAAEWGIELERAADG